MQTQRWGGSRQGSKAGKMEQNNKEEVRRIVIRKAEIETVEEK